MTEAIDNYFPKETECGGLWNLMNKKTDKSQESKWVLSYQACSDYDSDSVTITVNPNGILPNDAQKQRVIMRAHPYEEDQEMGP